MAIAIQAFSILNTDTFKLPWSGKRALRRGKLAIASRKQPTNVIFINWHSIRASYSTGKTGFSAKKKCPMTVGLFWISNISPLKISNLDGLVIKREHRGTSQWFLGFLCKWNYSVFQYNDSWALCGLLCHLSQELIRLSYILLQLSVHSYWDFVLWVIETSSLIQRL